MERDDGIFSGEYLVEPNHFTVGRFRGRRSPLHVYKLLSLGMPNSALQKKKKTLLLRARWQPKRSVSKRDISKTRILIAPTIHLQLPRQRQTRPFRYSNLERQRDARNLHASKQGNDPSIHWIPRSRERASPQSRRTRRYSPPRRVARRVVARPAWGIRGAVETGRDHPWNWSAWNTGLVIE